MEIIKQISEETIKRYSDRFAKLGSNVKTLGWGSYEQQNYRFAQTIYTDFSTKSVLDIGCGFCDFYKFLIDNNIGPKKYIGWDINEKLLDVASSKFTSDDKFLVFKENISTIDVNNFESVADVGIMLGVLNFNLKNVIPNYEYSKLLITNAYRLINEVLIVDFLSTYVTPDYPQEDFVFYHDPKIMLDFALSLSPNVVLKHNYAAIPQKEFMLFIYK